MINILYLATNSGSRCFGSRPSTMTSWYLPLIGCCIASMAVSTDRAVRTSIWRRSHAATNASLTKSFLLNTNSTYTRDRDRYKIWILNNIQIADTWFIFFLPIDICWMKRKFTNRFARHISNFSHLLLVREYIYCLTHTYPNCRMWWK